MKVWDVIVIGAGPAGSTAARVLASSGKKVLIIDKDKFPRDKPCGGGLSVAALKELKLNIPKNIIENICYGMRSIYKGRVTTVIDNEPVAYMVKRVKFDSYLLDKAIESGAVFKVLENRKVVETSNGVIVETNSGSYQCKVCIGADGFFSKTSHIVRKPFSKKEVRCCYIAQVDMKNIYNEIDDKSYVELDYGYCKMGYAWAFPKSDLISTGIGGSCENSSELENKLLNFLEMHKLQIKKNTEKCFIPVSKLKHSVATDRIMLIGDAAGFVDSFSGEGIKNAVVSGELAGQIAIKQLDLGEDISVLEYEDSVKDIILKNLKWSLFITNVAFLFEDIFFNILLFDKSILRTYYKVMRGDISYKYFFFYVFLKFPIIILKHIKYKLLNV